MIRPVTGFVPIADNPRGAEEYRKLGRELLKGIRPFAMYAEQDIDDCWLFKYLEWAKFHNVTCSAADNPKKNTKAYHIVQHQKTLWMMNAAYMDPEPDVFAWIDFGILSVPGVTVAVINDMLEKAATEKSIVIPGCWEWPGQQPRVVPEDQPCWRFCGGLIVCPRKYLMQLDTAFRLEAIEHINCTRNLSWEVNTLARLEQLGTLPIWWYKADHDASMFTNYPETRHAS